MFVWVNLLSRIKPKYFTVSRDGIDILLTEIFGQKPHLRVNVVWTNLLWFNLTSHSLYHSDCRFKWNCKLVEAIIGSLCIDKITLSSA